MTTDALPVYNQVDASFQLANLEMSAAEAHGVLCGMLVCEPNMKVQTWINVIFEGETAWDSLSVALRRDLLSILSATVMQLQQMDFQFELLLPDEELPLIDRIEALQAWCQGFSFGFGLLAREHLDRYLNGLCREGLEDLLKFSQIQTDLNIDTITEMEFHDILEHMRMVVLTLFEEFIMARGTEVKSANGHSDRLH
jgi:uncharacterized protein YgfB (UPF0149 family)